LTLIVAGIVLMIGARQATAASTNWTGGAGDGKWETSGNWSNGVPGTNGVVTITTGTVGVNANTSSLTSLTVSGGTLTLNGTSALNINGTGTPFFTVSGGSFKGGGGGLTVSGDVTISGTATYQAPSGTTSISGNLNLTGGSYAGAGTTTVTKNVDVKATATSGGDPTLVGYWSFDDASHTADTSGNGYTLTWTGSPSFPSTNLATLPFDTASPQYAVAMTGQQTNGAAKQYGATAKLSTICSSSPNLCPATLSLAAWYKATSIDKVASEIVSGSNTYSLRISSTGLVVMKRIAISGSAQWIEYQVPFSGVLDGNWHQIVGVITTGTGGSMTAYLDGAVAAGSYVIGGTTTTLDNTTTPTATAAAQAAIDWTDSGTTETSGLVIGYNPSGATGYNFGANYTSGSTGKTCGASDSSTTSICAIDDVRVYNRALAAAEVAALAHGNQPASSEGVLSLGGTLNVTGSVTIESTGTLTLSTGGTLGVGTSGSNGLTIDGTLKATGGTITMSGATRYPFVVGSISTAAPTLNINGLSVQNVDTNGMQINASGGSSTGASTTFTEFDKVTFGNGAGGTQNQLLDIFGSSLYLVSNGCTFGSGSTYAVALTSTAASGTGPRALFGNATCPTNDSTGLCATSEKQDNDTCVSGVCTGVPTTSTGSVVQFIRAAESDTDGTLVGFPTAAFNWNNFTYYSTYVTFHNASGGNDTIYVRDESGNPLYSWTNSADKISGTDETIVGTPQWMTDSSSGNHYVYVAVNGGAANTGGVYRLLDTTGSSGSLALDTSWVPTGTGSGAGYYACQCTVTSALTLDASNIYWAATSSSGQMLFGIKQLDGSAIKTGWPATAPSNVTTSAPTIVTSAGMLYLGSTSTLAQLTLSSLAWEQDNPTGIGTITGRVSYGTSILTATFGTTHIFVGDSAGAVWAISPSAFSSTGTVTTYLWKYAAGSAVTDNYYDNGTDTVMFGTSGGALVALTGAGSAGLGAVVNSSYPYTLPNSDSVSTAPLYYQGVVVVGSSKGNLYFLDRNTGNATAPNGVKILKEVNFGSTESVSTIGFDTTVSRFMVSTSSAANDGRIYYFDLITDPTSSSQ
jgi:hypothetical protein